MKLPSIKLQARERLLAMGSGLVLLAVVLDRLVLSPWLEHSRMVREETQHMERALQTHARLLQRKNSVLTAHARYARFLRPAIADDLHMAALLKEIEDLATQSQVALAEIKPSVVETTSIDKRYSLDVRFQCALDEWVNFMYRIDTSTSMYQVMRAGLTRLEDGSTQLDGYLRLLSTASLAHSGEAGTADD